MAESPDFEAALAGLRAGDKTGLDSAMPALYAELHRIAEACLALERPDHTLQPTALVHEAYLRLLGQHNPDWSCRNQVLGLAARITPHPGELRGGAQSRETRRWLSHPDRRPVGTDGEGAARNPVAGSGTKPSGGDRRTPGADRGIAIFLRAECRRNGCGPGHFFGNGQA